MASEHQFILDLTTALGAAAVGGYLANRLRQPVLVGYLASGLAIGPFGFKLIGEVAQIKALAEVGVAFLLFALGVEFSLAELKRVKDIALKGSVLQIGLTITLVGAIAFVVGWVESWQQGVFLGAMLSLSSTAVVLKTLTERGEINTVHGQIMLAILIAQDLALGLMLAILPALDGSENIGKALLAAVLKATLFFAAAFAAGRWLVPPLIKNIARTESGELFLLTVIALCLVVSLITSELGLSIEMGAFVAGLMVSEIDYSEHALAKVLPLRDTFACVFFASIGMLIDPQVILNNLGAISGLVVLVALGKALIIAPIVLKFGYSFKTAIVAGLGLSQIGEFSFVLAVVGRKLDFIDLERYLLLVGVTAISLILTPAWLRFAPNLADRLSKVPLIAKYLGDFQGIKALSVPETIRDHVVVAGYGRVGKVIVKILRNQGQRVLVIENSEAAIQRLRQKNIPYIFGDADSELVLEKAHLETAKALAIALPDPNSTRLLMKRALEFAPELDVVARCHNNSEIDLLAQLGAKEVVQPEFEAALEMGAHLLSALGETQWQIQPIISKIRNDRYLSVREERARDLVAKDLTDMTSQLQSQWVTLEENSTLTDMTLARTNLRNLTGVTVMAIQRDRDMFYYPKGDTRLKADDRLLVVGNPSELEAFHDLLLGRLSVGEGYSHWVTIAEGSQLIGLYAGEIGDRYGVGVGAARRHGQLLNYVDGGMKLETEDCLLLYGDRDRVDRVANLAQSVDELAVDS